MLKMDMPSNQAEEVKVSIKSVIIQDIVCLHGCFLNLCLPVCPFPCPLIHFIQKAQQCANSDQSAIVKSSIVLLLPDSSFHF